MNFGDAAGAVIGAASGISNLANSLAARLGGSVGSYFDQLRPASFRGVSFVSLGGSSSFGRRKQPHEYPQRDEPWVEDLGRGTRRIRMLGFVIGDNVIAQRDVMIAACEASGDGELVHPTLGRRTVSLMDFRSVEHWERGRYFEFQFEFIEGGPRTYPTAEAATLQSVLNSVTGLNVAAALDFAQTALNAVSYGAAVLGSIVNTAVGWYTFATGLIGDARNLFQLLFSLPGDFGRFFGSATKPTFGRGQAAPAPSGTTVQSLIESATAARANVTAAASALDAAARSFSASTIDNFTGAVRGVTAAMLAATNDPSDSVRLLAMLATFSASSDTTTSVIGTAMGDVEGACADLFRRTSIGAVAQASASYQPKSSDEAAQMRDFVTGLIDSEMAIAGDSGADQTYEALSALRAAVVADLNKRGAALSSIKTFEFAQPMPSLALATRIYRDPRRADELVSEADPPHPAFMPITFKALAN
ncbi:DNA circularization protein [Burkholderia vietnamiensis]|uniref:DNA circularization protein n=1 Tax=Burkholderia vietnamiensis TaxID=60552 RepID=UPI001B947CFF|nr:DNA circularization N-terminal domain-containing protein [Burkholderia vietnamiensis]MBR8030789.1 DNA circularization N-terminal domain-containing protein [Burkholderia vietnamiensis]